MHYLPIKLYILCFIEKIQDFNSRSELFLDISIGVRYNNEIISSYALSANKVIHTVLH